MQKTVKTTLPEFQNPAGVQLAHFRAVGDHGRVTYIKFLLKGNWYPLFFTETAPKLERSEIK